MAVAIYSFCFPLVKLRCLFHLLSASRALRNAIQLKKFPPIPPSLFELEQATGFLPSIWPLSANSIWPCVRSGRIRMALFLLLIIPTLFSPITFSMQILSVGRQRHFLVLILRPWSVHDVVSCQNFSHQSAPDAEIEMPTSFSCLRPSSLVFMADPNKEVQRPRYASKGERPTLG